MFDEMVRLIQEDTTRRLYFTVLNRQATEAQAGGPAHPGIPRRRPPASLRRRRSRPQNARARGKESGPQRSLPLRQRQKI